MSYFVSKIGHLDSVSAVLYTVLYQGSRCRGSRCPTLFPKLDIWPPVSTVLYTVIPGVQMSGVQMSGVQMSDFISKIGHLAPCFYSVIYCDTGGPDVGGPDVGGPDVGGPDVRLYFQNWTSGPLFLQCYIL